MALKPVDQFPAGGVDSYSNPLQMSTNRYLRVRNLVPRPNGEVTLRDGYSRVTMQAVDPSQPIHSISPFFDQTTGDHVVIFWQGKTPKLLNLTDWSISTLSVRGTSIQSSEPYSYVLTGLGHLMAFNGTDKKWFATYNGVSAWRDVGLRTPTDDEIANVAITEGVREMSPDEASAVTLTPSAGGSFDNTARGGLLFYVAIFDPAFNEIGPATIPAGNGDRLIITSGPGVKITLGTLPDLSSVNANWIKLIARTEDSQLPAYFCTNTSGDIAGTEKTADDTLRVNVVGHGLTTGDVVIQSNVPFSDTSDSGGAPFDGVFSITVIDADHFDVKITPNANATPSGAGGKVKRIVSAGNAVSSVDVTETSTDTSYVANQDRGVPASEIGGTQPGYQYHLSIKNIVTGHVGNSRKIGFRIAPEVRTNVHLDDLPDFSTVDSEWAALIGRTKDGGETAYAVTDNDGNFASVSSSSVPTEAVAGSGTNDDTVTATIFPSTFLFGWGANQHVGDFEPSGVPLGHSVPLANSSQVANTYVFPENVADGDDDTFSIANITGTQRYFGCVWKFNGPVSLSATLNILSEVPGGSGVRARDAGIWYSLDDQATWTKIYQSSFRSKQVDSVALPSGQDLSKVYVMAFMDGHDNMTHLIYSMSIEHGSSGVAWTNPANVGSTAADASVTVTNTDPASKILSSTDFGLLTPDQIITGLSFVMEIELIGSGGTMANLMAQILKNGNPVGSLIPLNITPGRADYTIGGPSELFGTTWLAADVDNAASGIDVTVTLNSGVTQTYNIRNVRMKVHGVGSSSVAVLSEPNAEDTLEMPSRNGLPPAFDKIWREADRLCGSVVGSPEVFRSASEGDATTGDFVGLPEQSWPGDNVETTPTAEVVIGGHGYQQESWINTHSDLAVLSELMGSVGWKGPFPGGIAGQKAWAIAGPTPHLGNRSLPFWLSPQRQLLSVDDNGNPIPVSTEYEATLLAKIGRDQLASTEMEYISIPERNLDVLYISAQDEDGLPFAIIHDFSMADSNSTYGQAYEYRYQGALAAKHTISVVKDETGDRQLWAGASNGQLYRLFFGPTDDGAEIAGETIGLKYLGPNRDIPKEISWYGDRKARFYIAKALNTTEAITDFHDLGAGTPYPEHEKDGMWRVIVDEGDLTHCYLRMVLNGHSADGTLDLNDPPHLPLETYGRVYVVTPAMGVARGAR